jgi:hypothetical protein
VSDSMERSEEEREAARIERERQRAERAGSGPVASQEEPEEHALEEASDGTEDWEELEDPEELEDGEDPSLDYDEDDELPAGTKRISRLQRQRIAESSGRPARPAKPAKPRRTPNRRHSWGVRVLSLIALVLAGGVIWFLVELLQPFHASGHGSVTVTIPPHSTSSDIGDLLERDGVIDSSFFFDARATLAGDRSDMRAGT